MSMDNLVSQIDVEINRLQQVRALLSGVESGSPKAKGSADKPRRKKRKLSPEGRARIVAALKKRWAAQKKAAK